ncbi:MAG TPA: hypothetical protein VN950_11480 [Terriglobales bacterium]|nr:hypothetical protein [Terriglobales bacterium]
MKKLYRKSPFLLAVTELILISASWAWAQSPAQPPQTGAATAATPQSAEPGQDKKTAAADAGTQEQKISPKEAEELFRDVDQIMQFASKETGLPIRNEVKRRLVSRDEVVAYLEKNMAEDKDAQRLRRSELVLKKFGLLPRDFDLQTFLVALLREQVAGYYDVKTKTVNLLDWIDSEQQRPVLAHELTHALQDQSFGLEKWMKVGDTDLNDKKETTAADIENDEISEARQAVVEGQAMVALVDYLLAPTDQSIVTSPQIADALKEGMLVGSADSPEFKDAPIFLKEELTFPYRYGLDFETELLRTGGKEKAFASAFSNPPRTTRQIMEPKTYLSREQLEPMRVPDFQRDFKNYERFDVGAIGEFDVAILVDQYAGKKASDNLYPHWRGGYYYAARPKADPAAPLSLVYVSRWSTPERASAFAAIYAQSLAKRYRHVSEVTPDSKDLPDNSRKIDTLTGTHTWLTEEGPVVIAVVGGAVLITEGLDQSTTEQLEHELFEPATATAQ